MHRVRQSTSALVIGIFLLMGAEKARAADQPWKAGAARVNITPQKMMWMAGYGSRDKPAEGKLTDLWAKALVLEDAAGHRVVLVTFDLVGIDRALSQRVCSTLQEKFGFARNDIALCASHTHCGPVVENNLRPLHFLIVDAMQQQLIAEYTRELEKKLVAVVGDAVAQLAPREVRWGSSKATYAVNRRNNAEAKVVEIRQSGNIQGPFDHDVPVLAVLDGEKLTAVVFGYACHATVLSFYQWCADHPGFAQEQLEKNHPDCIAMFWAGCGADQNPLPRRTVERAKHYGQRLAVAVDEALLTTELNPVAPKITTSYAEIDLLLDALPTREQLEADTRSDNKYVVARAKMLLDQINNGKELAKSYPYPIAVWKLGDEVQFITLGGEVVVDYAIRLKAELAGPKTWVAGYSHDVMAYIPSRRVLQEGGYEGGGAMVYYGLPTIWAPDVEENIVAEVHRQIGGQ
jgi:neutral ceramidase